jgi:DNA modification methylase
MNDQTQLFNDEILDPKRDFNTQSGIEKWYDYYAGYSIKFAKALIEKTNLQTDSVVFDPWSGSGTTTYVSDRMGYESIGVDINPVAVLVSNAKLAKPMDATYIIGLAKHIAEQSSSASVAMSIFQDPLTQWLDEVSVLRLRSIESLILNQLCTNSNGKILDPIKDPLPPLASFLLLALMRGARTLASIQVSSNPTWITPGMSLTKSAIPLIEKWLTFIETMADDLSDSGDKSNSRSRIILADSRELPLGDNTIDFILTSPPYCTRIDYAVSTSFELCVLGMNSAERSFKNFRRTLMGTPLVRRSQKYPPKRAWPLEVKRILKEIQGHSSKASSSYYYKTYWDYFDDCQRSLKELHRVSKTGSKSYFVVQGSFYKEIYIDLPNIYRLMGEKQGFRTEIISSIQATHSLSQINVRSAQYRSLNDLQSESVVYMEKTR